MQSFDRRSYSCLGDVQLGHFMISEPYIFHTAAERQAEADCICCVCSQPVRLSVEQKQPPVQSHGPTSSRGTQSDGDVSTYGTPKSYGGSIKFSGRTQTFRHTGTSENGHRMEIWNPGTLEPEPFTAAWLQSWENFAPGGVGRPLRPLPGHPVHSCHFWSNP